MPFVSYVALREGVQSFSHIASIASPPSHRASRLFPWGHPSGRSGRSGRADEPAGSAWRRPGRERSRGGWARAAPDLGGAGLTCSCLLTVFGALDFGALIYPINSI